LRQLELVAVAFSQIAEGFDAWRGLFRELNLSPTPSNRPEML
jgi:hypothetical protein